MVEDLPVPNQGKPEEYFKQQIAKNVSSKRQKIIEKFALAALGSIPWIGGFLSAAASIKTDEGTEKQNDLQTKWLEEHGVKMKRLAQTLDDVSSRIDNMGEEIKGRIESEEYLDLVRKSFRSWDKADTDEKRKYVANLITNAAGTRLCSDDVIRLFIDWLNLYHEAHFAVIRHIFQNPACTRYDIWMAMHGELVQENSAEADLYKMLIRDLSTGGVIRQERETTWDGQFVKKKAPKRRSASGSKTMKSAFDDETGYELTELGKQFVHYTMNEVVARIEES